MRYVLSLVVVGALAASVFASAASLNVQGGAVQAGADMNLVCDPDGVQVSAWAVNTIAGQYEGVDWVTISGVDGACAGNDLVVRLDVADGTSAYGGAYNGSAQAANASNAPVIPVVAGVSDYKVALHHDVNTSQRWFVPADQIVTLRVWLGGANGQ